MTHTHTHTLTDAMMAEACSIVDEQVSIVWADRDLLEGQATSLAGAKRQGLEEFSPWKLPLEEAHKFSLAPRGPGFVRVELGPDLLREVRVLCGSS